MNFLDYIWLIPLFPLFGAAMMLLFGRKLDPQPPSEVAVAPGVEHVHDEHDHHGHSHSHGHSHDHDQLPSYKGFAETRQSCIVVATSTPGDDEPRPATRGKGASGRDRFCTSGGPPRASAMATEEPPRTSSPRDRIMPARSCGSTAGGPAPVCVTPGVGVDVDCCCSSD